MMRFEYSFRFVYDHFLTGVSFPLAFLHWPCWLGSNASRSICFFALTHSTLNEQGSTISLQLSLKRKMCSEIFSSPRLRFSALQVGNNATHTTVTGNPSCLSLRVLSLRDCGGGFSPWCLLIIARVDVGLDGWTDGWMDEYLFLWLHVHDLLFGGILLRTDCDYKTSDLRKRFLVWNRPIHRLWLT